MNLTLPIDPSILHTWWGIEGEVLCGEYPYSAQAHSHKLDALIKAGFTTFVDLTHIDDQLESYQGDLSISTLDNLMMIKNPIPNEGVVELDNYIKLASKILLSLEHGDKVYLHCWGGVGRTATVLGVLLALRSDWPSELIFEYIDAQRATTSKGDRPAPSTQEQCDIVRQMVGLVNQIREYKY